MNQSLLVFAAIRLLAQGTMGFKANNRQKIPLYRWKGLFRRCLRATVTLTKTLQLGPSPAETGFENLRVTKPYLGGSEGVPQFFQRQAFLASLGALPAFESLSSIAA